MEASLSRGTGCYPKKSGTIPNGTKIDRIGVTLFCDKSVSPFPGHAIWLTLFSVTRCVVFTQVSNVSASVACKRKLVEIIYFALSHHIYLAIAARPPRSPNLRAWSDLVAQANPTRSRLVPTRQIPWAETQSVLSNVNLTLSESQELSIGPRSVRCLAWLPLTVCGVLTDSTTSVTAAEYWLWWIETE